MSRLSTRRSMSSHIDFVAKALDDIRSTVQSFSSEVDKPDEDPVGIANVIYKIGVKIGSGKTLSYVDTVCAEIERHSPKKRWNNVRRSECRTLLRRYWEIPQARELLAGAHENCLYPLVLSILRITSRGHGVEAVVAKFLDDKKDTTGLSWLLTQVEQAAE